MKKLLIAIAFVPLWMFVGMPSLHAEDIYAGHASTGGNTGANCANQVAAATFFNNSGNWGAGAGKISAGDTFHICTGETLTSADKLIFQASGTAGNVITLQFDANAKMSAATWGNGSSGLAISIPNGSSYLKVTGTTACGFVAQVHVTCTEYIEATANGSNLANQDDDTGVFCRFCNHVEIANLGGYNMFVQRQADTHYAQHGTAFQIGGSDDHISYTDVSQAYTGIEIDYNAGAANIEMDHNSAHNVNFAIVGSPFGNNTHANGYLIHDNEAYDWQNWDDVAGNCCHHNGVILPTQGSNTDNVGIDGLQIYNNYWHGDSGAFMTAHIFLDCEEVGDYCFPGSLFFNNIHVAGAGGNSPANGFMSIGSGNNLVYTIGVYNNTFMYTSQLGGRCIQGSGAAWTFKNNTFLNCGQVYYTQTDSSQLVASDYNNFWIPTSGAAPMTYFGPDGSTNQTFAGYKMATGFDAHSTNVTPNYNTTNFVPNSGSPLISAGLNVSSDCSGCVRDFYNSTRAIPYTVGAVNAGTPGPPPAALFIVTNSIPSGTVSSSYSLTLNATGGSPPYIWSGSSFPAGLQLSASGVLSGTPTTSGLYLPTFLATDTRGASGSINLSMNIASIQPPACPPLPARFLANDTFKVATGGGSLTIRTAPSATSSKAGSISNGTTGTIVSGPFPGDWWKVSKGYVSGTYIRQ